MPCQNRLRARPLLEVTAGLGAAPRLLAVRGQELSSPSPLKPGSPSTCHKGLVFLKKVVSYSKLTR